MKTITVNKIEKNEYTVKIHFTTTNDIANYFNDNTFYCKYNSSIEGCPDEDLLLPFYYNVLPIVFFKNVNLHLPILSESVLKKISDLKLGFSEIYPKSNLGGHVFVDKIVKEKRTKTNSKNGMLFSGGVDSTASLINHLDEKPVLLTVFGADIKEKDEKGILRVKEHVNNITNLFDLDSFSVSTNFRTFLNYRELEYGLNNVLGGDWWQRVQHGMGLVSLFSPLSYVHDFSTIYIPGTNNDKWDVPCGSEPRIDNHVVLNNTTVFHDMFTYTRQDKVSFISNYIKETNTLLQIRVCYESAGGRNCCRCQKCVRTMLGFSANDINLTKIGFDKYNENYIKRSFIFGRWNYNEVQLHFFQEIQNSLKLTNREDNSLSSWFKEFPLEKYVKTSRSILSYPIKYSTKVQRKINRLLNAL